MDEHRNLCPRTSCPGQLICNTSAMCVGIGNLCDNIIDCPLGDDELLCLQQVPYCPINCSCLFFSVVCDNWELSQLNVNVKSLFIFVTLLSSNVSDFKPVFALFNQSVSFELRQNKLNDLCASLINLQNKGLVAYFNVAWNVIRNIGSNCLRSFSALFTLILSHNEIDYVASHAFKESPKLSLIDLSCNKLQNIQQNTFSGIEYLPFLNITYNNIKMVDPNGFIAGNVRLIATHSYKVCCAVNPFSAVCPYTYTGRSF